MKKPVLMAEPESGVGMASEAPGLSPWFHNLHLPDGSQTAPTHPLGDFPACKWREIAPHLPEKLEGWSVLDVGCNAGFYSIELARRGADVTAVDKDSHFLKQAQWAVRQFGLENKIQLLRSQVYQLAHLEKTYDLVLFLGVFYHLRYPLLALDLVAEKARRLLVVQTLSLPGEDIADAPEDLQLLERDVMVAEGWPKMAFIENALAGDKTNWWAPNGACVEAMLRSTGVRTIRRIAHEIYLCETDGDLEKRRTWPTDELHSVSAAVRPAAFPTRI